MDEIFEQFKTMCEQFEAAKLTGEVSLVVKIQEGMPVQAYKEAKESVKL